MTDQPTPTEVVENLRRLLIAYTGHEADATHAELWCACKDAARALEGAQEPAAREKVLRAIGSARWIKNNLHNFKPATYGADSETFLKALIDDVEALDE